MNIRTIKELCAEAGLKCEAYRVPLSEALCFSIVCFPSPTGRHAEGVVGFSDPVCALVEVMMDQPVMATLADIEAMMDEMHTLMALLKGGRAAYTTRAGQRLGVLFWPHLAWEE